MSTETASHPPARDPAEGLCSHCGAELAEDQEWCLECGGARTLIHSPPDWRIPVAVIAGVVLIALVVLAIVLVNLSTDANRAAARGTTTATTPTTAATRPTAPAASPGPPGWPVGLPGWTVVLASNRKRAAALADARRIAAAGIQVGVLDSTLHPHLRAGFWIVFSGRYPTKSQARAAASQLISLGQPRAHVRLVGGPGT
jgi:septal ring-binding cell division protein DamX